jgi:hypothetical protein
MTGVEESRKPGGKVIKAVKELNASVDRNI